MARLVLGVALGSTSTAADAVALRVEGVGLALRSVIAGHARAALPADVRDALAHPTRAADALAEQLANLLSRATLAAGESVQSPLVVGLTASLDCAEALAELAGITVASHFSRRDRALGGRPALIGAAADWLLLHSPETPRTLIHLGGVTTLLHLPANAPLKTVVGLTAGPGHRLLDDLISLGTRAREHADLGGIRAVQGKCLEPLLADWLRLPRLSAPPPRPVSAAHFGGPFLTESFDRARADSATLNDLLCTATHLIARATADAARRWLPPLGEVFVSGNGSRNGFLRQRLAAELEVEVQPLDRLGLPATARAAATSALLACLLIDGVPGNLPHLTGATGSRLLGHLTPGTPRNWALVTRWLADPHGAGLGLRAAG